MLSLSLSGDDALDARLDAYAGALGDAFAAKAETLAQALADTVKSDKLSGQVLAARSGALRDSIEAEVAADGDSIVATIASVGDVKYAAIQEYGGRTAAHEIVPDKALALAFIVGGALRFARRVEHPGSTLPARAYLGSSPEESREDIVDAFAAVATQAWEDR